MQLSLPPGVQLIIGDSTGVKTLADGDSFEPTADMKVLGLRMPRQLESRPRAAFSIPQVLMCTGLGLWLYHVAGPLALCGLAVFIAWLAAVQDRIREEIQRRKTKTK